MEEIKNIGFNEEMSDKVDRFLRKTMTKAESETFQEELKTNPELKKYYLRQFNLMRGIKMENMRKVMKAEEKKIQDRQAVKVIVIDFVSRYKYVVAMAAMLICGVFIWDVKETKTVGNEEYSLIVVRGADEIDEYVERGKYKDAISSIDKELNQKNEFGDDPMAKAAYDQSMNDLKYRKALIYLKMGKKHKAKKILKKLKELNDDRSKAVLNKLH